jgi:hypothetical protein
MLPLDQEYKDKLEAIKAEIQASKQLEIYLETEEEDDYRQLIEAFESKILELHQELAEKNPLQMLEFEYEVLSPEYEGLFIPKILGYSVLRGVIDDHYKYRRPQKHFRNIVEFICNSANFEMLKIRIGQSIQIGLALSSSIWVTNLINEFTNKKVKQYLQSKNQAKYRDEQTRKREYHAYKKQFRADNYQTTFFPEKKNDLKGDYYSLYEFLTYRVKNKYPALSYEHLLIDFCKNEDYMGTREHANVTFFFAHFIERSEHTHDALRSVIEQMEKHDNLPKDYYKFRLQSHEDNFMFFGEQDERMHQLISKKSSIFEFINMAIELHQKGYLHDDAINAIKEFYNTHPGSSIENECVRKLLLGYFGEFLTNIDPDEYEDYMDFAKIFPIYLEIFANEHFLLALRAYNLQYLKKLLKTYTDKRGKDYQDIKKFVMASWVDFGFYEKKKLAEFFKTKRKKKKANP